VLVLALATVLLQAPRLGLEGALFAGLSVVLISCPCALGIATPLAFWVALGEAWRRGALVRGAETLEALAGARRVLFDKTGTLSDDSLELVAVEAQGGDDVALALAAALERDSEHPIGRALRGAAARRALAPPDDVVDFRALPGRGVRGRVDGRLVALVRDDDRAGDGADDATRVRLEAPAEGAGGEPVTIARFALRARPRAEAAGVIDALRALGLEASVLTGDAEGPARALGRELALPVEHGLTPADKLARVDAAGEGTVYVGDGLNDTAALAAASVGVSVSGGVGRSLEAASVNLLRPGLAVLPDLIRLSRRALGVARINLAWAFGYNALGLGFAVAGRLSPIFAASAMVVSSAFVVLHSGTLRRGAAGAQEVGDVPPSPAATPPSAVARGT